MQLIGIIIVLTTKMAHYALFTVTVVKNTTIGAAASSAIVFAAVTISIAAIIITAVYVSRSMNKMNN